MTSTTLIDAQFCLSNPDVLHTPAQHREIIAGLVGLLELQHWVNMPAQPERAAFIPCKCGEPWVLNTVHREHTHCYRAADPLDGIKQEGQQAQPERANVLDTPLSVDAEKAFADFGEAYMRMEDAMKDGINVHGALSNLSGCQDNLRTVLAEQQAQPEPLNVVAYLDIGAGGYLDLGSNLTDEQLQKLPNGRHALEIIGTYGIDGYLAAPKQAQPERAPKVNVGTIAHIGASKTTLTAAIATVLAHGIKQGGQHCE
jgi:hypothetical protein